MLPVGRCFFIKASKPSVTFSITNILPEYRLNPFLVDKLVRTVKGSMVPFLFVATTTQEVLE
jgi:hypothetical protein